MRHSLRSMTGLAAIAGGVAGLLLAPVMVIIKYMTGWAVVREPSWIAPAKEALGLLLQFATPPNLWTVYGSLYTVALVLMFIGLIGLQMQLRNDDGRLHSKGYWVVIAGFVLVIPGDAIHTWTWHQNGLATPTPGTNPLANTAYAVHMMGMNLIMLGSMIAGVSALRRRSVARWLGWSLVLVFPSALVASLTALPTTPSGALWWLGALIAFCGYLLMTDQRHRLLAA